MLSNRYISRHSIWSSQNCTYSISAFRNTIYRETIGEVGGPESSAGQRCCLVTYRVEISNRLTRPGRTNAELELTPSCSTRASLLPSLIISAIVGILIMKQASFTLGLSLLGGAIAAQEPLFAPPAASPQIPVTGGKELVSSESIQERINADNLLQRAKKLYSIAELGEEEYNHPTRVIGSKGIISSDSVFRE